MDAITDKRLIFLTNNINHSAETIAALYNSRWQGELFFKWIKQYLGIKTFYGTSENAVKTQIWIAISICVLITIFGKELKIKHSLYIILPILSEALFEKTPILQALEGDNEKINTADSNFSISSGNHPGAMVLATALATNDHP